MTPGAPIRLSLNSRGYDMRRFSPLNYFGAPLLLACLVLGAGSLHAQSRFAEVQAEREAISQAQYFALFADAAWVAAEAEVEPHAGLRAEAYAALQESMAGAANRAIVEMAVRRFADRAEEGLGAIVRERQSLADQWTANSESYALTFSASNDADEEMRGTLRAERERIEARMDAIDAMLRTEFPDYFALVRPEPLTVEQTAALLTPDEAILLAVPTEFGTHVMALTSDGATWARSEWTHEEIGDAVRRLRWDVGATVIASPEEIAAWSVTQEQGLAFDRNTAHALYEQIVAPVRPALLGRTQLFVASGRALSSLPFALLVVDPPQGSDSDGEALRSTHWFANDFALTHIPSVQSLQLLRQVEERSVGGAAQIFAGFGDPALGGVAQTRGVNRGGNAAPAANAVFTHQRSRSGVGIADVQELSLMSRLPGTAIELNNMRAALGAPPSAVKLSDQATETAVRTADLSNTRIIAFATHGLTAYELGDFAEPGLVFTPPQEASERDDGYLTASEVATLRLNADWVILSACNTAAGDGNQGSQGLSGLARAFFYAGARNLLASHWPVNDEVAAAITVRTIELARNDAQLSRAQAFQQAMREIRDDASHDTDEFSWAHPYFWAPFILIGDGAN